MSHSPQPRHAGAFFSLAIILLAVLSAIPAFAQPAPSQALRELLRAPVPDNDRARGYQEALDRAVAGRIRNFERHPGVFSAGRNSTYSLGAMAFCHYSPISEHHGDPRIVAIFSDALNQWADGVDELGEPVTASYPGLGWSHAWDIEGFIYGYIWLEEHLDAELKQKAMAAFERSAERFVNRAPGDGHRGGVGNQRVIGCVGDQLYGMLLDRQDYIERGARRFADAGPKTLMENGQVVEQYGPCMHYSYTAIAYLFHYLYLAGDRSMDDRLLESMRWFHSWHTNSLYHFPGASSRGYKSIRGGGSGLYAMAEYLAPDQPMVQEWADQWREHQRGGIGHTCSTLIWAIMLCRDGNIEITEEHRRQWDEPVESFYSRVYFGRGPIQYALFRHNYQTSITFSGYLPLKGMQTWAWGDEPPVIHPTLHVRSAVRAMGVDSAEFTVSHEHPNQGPGAMAPQTVWRPHDSRHRENEDGPTFVVWRQGNLRSVAVFTPSSTVLIYSGPTGPRSIQWALNTWEPAEPVFGDDGAVRFDVRTPVIYSNLAAPELRKERDPDVNRDVFLLVYADEGEPAVFAFSNGSFRFIKDNLAADGILRFGDDTGDYQVDISTITDERGYLKWGDQTAKVFRLN